MYMCAMFRSKSCSISVFLTFIDLSHEMVNGLIYYNLFQKEFFLLLEVHLNRKQIVQIEEYSAPKSCCVLLHCIDLKILGNGFRKTQLFTSFLE